MRALFGPTAPRYTAGPFRKREGPVLVSSRDLTLEATLPARIALIGLSGAGKSAVAPLLAARLGLAHVDLDLAIERDEGTTIAELIRGRGEQAFREIESRALRRALEEDGIVIACGGGVLGHAENREALRRRAFVVWLGVTPATAASRIDTKGREARPLLDGGSLEERLRQLEAERGEVYRAMAQATFETDGQSAADVADAIAAEWRERAAWDSSAS